MSELERVEPGEKTRQSQILAEQGLIGTQHWTRVVGGISQAWGHRFKCPPGFKRLVKL